MKWNYYGSWLEVFPRLRLVWTRRHDVSGAQTAENAMTMNGSLMSVDDSSSSPSNLSKRCSSYRAQLFFTGYGAVDFLPDT